MYNRATSSPIAMPRMSTKTRLGSTRASLGMKESRSGTAIQPRTQPTRRGDRVLQLDPHSAHRRGLEPVELPVADRSTARQVTPLTRVLRSSDGVTRDTLPAADFLLQPADADRHRPTQIQLGRRTVCAGDTPVDGSAGREILGEQRRQPRPPVG